MEKVLKDLGNGAVISDIGGGGIQIEVPAGVKLGKPIYLTQLLDKKDKLKDKQGISIYLSEGSEADVVITDRTVGGRPFKVRRDICVDVRRDARLHLYLLQEQGAKSVWANDVSIFNWGHLSFGIFCFGEADITNRVLSDLCAEGATSDVFGMTIASGTQQMMNSVTVTHRAPRCTDRELFKQILDGEAVGRFEGLVQVTPHQPGADSQQTSRNICLSRAARAYAQPQLIIDTDDVRCSHGATVGQLDEEALFYMQQRGIPRHEARLLLLSAFLGEAIGKVAIPSVRDRLQLLADARLRGDLNHCVACGGCKNEE